MAGGGSLATHRLLAHTDAIRPRMMTGGCRIPSVVQKGRAALPPTVSAFPQPVHATAKDDFHLSVVAATLMRIHTDIQGGWRT